MFPANCAADEFECDDGLCQPGNYKCDGFWDCITGEDEQNCEDFG